jgi:hypothetical protein
VVTDAPRRDGKTVAIVQSCYIPWKGYFDLIGLADEFILYDDMQYTSGDWRNRNRVKTPSGTQWLTIPVKRSFGQRIDEAEVGDPRWAAKHWKTIAQSYRTAPHFERYRERLEELYATTERSLSRINRAFIEALCELLGIHTPLSWSTDYAAEGVRTERVVSLCRQAGATAYLSGPRAQDYLEEELFAGAGIELRYIDYSGYPEYPQLHGAFEHTVTVLDLLFSVGPDAPRYLKCGSRTGVAAPR